MKILNTNNISRFDEKSFFINLLGLSPNWDYFPNKEYLREEIISLTPIDKNHLNSDYVNGSTLKITREAVLF